MEKSQKHRLVEKKRRDKINSKVLELKDILKLSPDENYTQYDILTITIDYIKNIEKQNETLNEKIQTKQDK